MINTFLRDDGQFATPPIPPPVFNESIGSVLMFPPQGQLVGPWTVLDPYGNVISTSGTTTDGLQEAIDYAANNGFPLEVYGHGGTTVSQQNGTLASSNVITGLSTSAIATALANGTIYVTGADILAGTTVTSVDSSGQIHISQNATGSGTVLLRFAQNLIFIACTTGIQVPPVEQWSARFQDVNITFSTSVTGPCFELDSCMIVNFEFLGGQIVGQPNPGGAISYLVYFNPTNPVVADGIITITGSRFVFSNFAYPAATSEATAVWGFNVGAGSIDNSFFSCQELNGTGTGLTSNTQSGMLVFGAQSNTAFEQNIIDIADIHLVSSAGLQIGVSATHAGNYRHNIYRIGGIRPSGASSAGISSFGSKDQIYVGAITNEEGTLSQGINFQSGTVGNEVHVGEVLGAATALLDNGVGNVVYNNGTCNTMTNSAVKANGINFNSANTDTAITIPMPLGAIGYVLSNLRIGNASHDISAATFGLFSATGGGGTPVIAGGTAITVTSSSMNTANNTMFTSGSTTEAYNFATLYFRVGSAEGSSATADVVLNLSWIY